MEKKNLINLIKSKIKTQNGRRLFFDNLMTESLVSEIHNLNDNWRSRFTKLLIYLNSIKSDRYSSFDKREKSLCSFSGEKRTIDFWWECPPKATNVDMKSIYIKIELKSDTTE